MQKKYNKFFKIKIIKSEKKKKGRRKKIRKKKINRKTPQNCKSPTQTDQVNKGNQNFIYESRTKLTKAQTGEQN